MSQSLGIFQGIFQDLQHVGVNQPLGVPSLPFSSPLSSPLPSPSPLFLLSPPPPPPLEIGHIKSS